MLCYEVPSYNTLVDFAKQFKKGELGTYLDLHLFIYPSISLFIYPISWVSSDCWKRQHQKQLCGNVSTMYHDIGKLRTSPAVSAWFENVQYLVVAYWRVNCVIDRRSRLQTEPSIFCFSESLLYSTKNLLLGGKRCTRQNLCDQNYYFSFGCCVLLDRLYIFV